MSDTVRSLRIVFQPEWDLDRADATDRGLFATSGDRSEAD